MNNKIFVSSSNITDNVACIDRLFHIGVAGVITKTISSFYDGKCVGRIWMHGKNLFNTTGYSGKGINTWVKRLSVYREYGQTVIPSVFSTDRVELLEMMQALQQAEVPAIEVGLSCPNDIKLVSTNRAPNLVELMAGILPQIKIPVYLKLCAADRQLLSQIKEYRAMGASGFVLSDAFPRDSRATKKHYIGRSGDGIRNDVLKCIAMAREAGIQSEIVGTGGILTREHITEYIRVGADAVGLCSCIYLYGMDYVASLLI
jgi:dihydroorotate dehydrogenase